jgi:hypothetical protein
MAEGSPFNGLASVGIDAVDLSLSGGMVVGFAIVCGSLFTPRNIYGRRLEPNKTTLRVGLGMMGASFFALLGHNI